MRSQRRGGALASFDAQLEIRRLSLAVSAYMQPIATQPGPVQAWTGLRARLPSERHHR